MGLGWDNGSGPCLLCAGTLRSSPSSPREDKVKRAGGEGDCSIPLREVAGGPYYVTQPTGEKGCLDHRSERMCSCVFTCVFMCVFMCNRAGLTAGMECLLPYSQCTAPR